VAFSFAFVPVTLLLLVLGSTLWLVIVSLAFEADSSTWWVDVFQLLAAVVLIGAAPRAMVSVAHVERSFVGWFLGPDREVELRERVDELSTQRQAILDAVAGERRRIERNLHDGVQQQLVALGIDIGRASARIDTDPAGARQLLTAASDKVRGSIGELRTIGRGLHPAVLDDRGLDAALSAVVANSPIPMALHVHIPTELPDELAETAYYVVNEAVANVMKHSRARAGSVHVESGVESGVDVHVDRDVPDGGVDRRATLSIRVTDDGQGGADAGAGSGLAGMRARVQGSDGTLTIDSPVGGPTRLVAVLPIRAGR
jgi:signal transduction histidine kinase